MAEKKPSYTELRKRLAEAEKTTDAPNGDQMDAAERKRVEEALSSREEDLNRAQAVAHTGSWRLDIRSEVLAWSDESYRIFGIPKGTPMTYETFLEAVHPDDRKYVDLKWTAAMNGEPYDIQHRILVGGTVKWVRERAELEFDRNGRLSGGFGTVQDITERKRIEEALSRRAEDLAAARAEADAEKRRLLAVMEALPVAVAIIDDKGGVISTNRAFEETWGGPQPEVRSVEDYRPFQAWWVDTGKPIAPDEWASSQAIRHGKSVIGQLLEIQRFDGTRAFVLNSAAPIRDAEGKVTGSAVAIQDVTELRKTEQALEEAKDELEERVRERTAELEALNMELEIRACKLRALASELTLTEERERKRLAQVLHDNLQQLLAAAKFGVGSIKRQVTEENLVSQADRALDLIGQSIDVSRSLTIELFPPALHDAELTAGLLWLSRWMKDNHGLEVEVTAPGPLEALPEDVRLLLFRAVRELLFNVVKHSGVDRAKVILTRGDGKTVSLVVSDGGRGFDAKTSVPESAPGTFGLSSVRERLSLFDGRVEIESQPGRGTRVSLTVPIGPLKQAG
jgi:PAS domain S-box-containing protein